jgi:hypothetical protein
MREPSRDRRDDVVTYTSVSEIINRRPIDLAGFVAADDATLRTLSAGTLLARWFNGRWFVDELVKVNRTTATIRATSGELAGIDCRCRLDQIKGYKAAETTS